MGILECAIRVRNETIGHQPSVCESWRLRSQVSWLVEGNTGGSIDPEFQLELRQWNGSAFSDILL
jgi:hypothetical protein